MVFMKKIFSHILFLSMKTCVCVCVCVPCGYHEVIWIIFDMDLKLVLVFILALLSGLNTIGRLLHKTNIVLAWVLRSLACVPVIINVFVWLFGSRPKWEPIKIGNLEIIFYNFSNQVLSWLAFKERGVYFDICKLKEPTTIEDFIYVLMPHPHCLIQPFAGYKGS